MPNASTHAWSSLWMASLASLVVPSVLSSSSSPSAHQRGTVGIKRPSFMERTLVLLDVNTRSPIRVLNDKFLSLQLDPSIIKDGWLDFLRYLHVALSPSGRLSSIWTFPYSITHSVVSVIAWVLFFHNCGFKGVQRAKL